MVRRTRTALTALKMVVEEGRKVKAVQSKQARRLLCEAFDRWAYEFEGRQSEAMRPVEI